MKNLHNEVELFADVIAATSKALNIAPAIIEKDYFVTLLLKRIVEKSPEIIFKGGTSLSKCFKIINRFSEDIDIGLNVDKATEGMRKNFKSDYENVTSSLLYETVSYNVVKENLKDIIMKMF